MHWSFDIYDLSALYAHLEFSRSKSRIDIFLDAENTTFDSHTVEGYFTGPKSVSFQLDREKFKEALENPDDDYPPLVIRLSRHHPNEIMVGTRILNRVDVVFVPGEWLRAFVDSINRCDSPVISPDLLDEGALPLFNTLVDVGQSDKRVAMYLEDIFGDEVWPQIRISMMTIAHQFECIVDTDNVDDAILLGDTGSDFLFSIRDILDRFNDNEYVRIANVSLTNAIARAMVSNNDEGHGSGDVDIDIDTLTMNDADSLASMMGKFEF